MQAEKPAHKVFKVMYINALCVQSNIHCAFEVIEMANVSFRTDDETKAQAAGVDLGLGCEHRDQYVLRQSIVSNGIPFTPRRESPNLMPVESWLSLALVLHSKCRWS